MHISSVLIAVTASLASFAAAQSQNQTYTVLPNSVDTNLRISWCRAQRNTCPQLCNGKVEANTCDHVTLEFDCECLNGGTPNISDYAQTLPSLMCEEWKAQCIRANPDNLAGQNTCLAVQCGEKNASALVSALPSTSSASSASEPTEEPTEQPSATAPPPAAESTGAATALGVGQKYGTGAVLGLVGLAFGLAL